VTSAATHTLTAELVSIDVGCNACTGTLCEVPTEVGAVWLEAHRQPRLLALHLLVNGEPTTWVRRTA
jgi:hypothetical protein